MDQLKRSAPAPVYTLVGTEPVLFKQFIDGLVAALERAGALSMEVQRFRFDEEGADNALMSCQSLSLFSSTNVVILENCAALHGSGKTKFDTTALEAYAANPVDSSVLVITAYAEKLDERKKLTKQLSKYPVVRCAADKDETAHKIILQFVRAEDISVEPAAIAELWRRTGSVSVAQTELRKLAMYRDGQMIRVEDVTEMVTAPLEDNVFHWIDAVVKGQVRQAYNVLADIRLAGYDPFALFALIARQLRLMWFAKVLSERGYSGPQIASKAGAHPYAVKVAGEQARRLSVRRLEDLLVLIADAEFAVKSGKRDMEQALDLVVMSCCASHAGKPAWA